MLIKALMICPYLKWQSERAGRPFKALICLSMHGLLRLNTPQSCHHTEPTGIRYQVYFRYHGIGIW